MLVFCFLLLSSRLASAQATGVAAEHNNNATAAPLNGFNFSLENLAEHNSSTGWSDNITPDISYRANKHFFLDVQIPWYLYVNAEVSNTVKGVTTTQKSSTRNVIGDVATAAHLEISHHDFGYEATGSLGFATGNSRYGLSANTTTYNITNHFEYNIGPFTPDIEIGAGNSSSFANTTVKQSYVAVGPVANFQVGSSINLPWEISLDLEAYEDLPIGNQKVYGTVTRKNKNGKTTSTQVLQGAGTAEDNGFTSELDIPVGDHFVLAGTYERSLVQGLDTVSVGLTWTLRKPTSAK